VTSRVHRRLVTSLIALGSLVATVAVFAVWLDRQALDTGEWTNASGRLLQDAQVRGALAAYEVDVLYDNVDVAGQLGRMLPPDARPLAGPAALAVRPLLQQAAQRALGTPLALDAWRRANRLAHRRLLAILDGGGGPVSTRNGTVSLDLRALVGQVAGATGASIPLPADSARLVVLHSDELQTAQRVVQGIRGLAALLTVLGVGLYATAFALAGGWRRVALRNIGIGAIAAGVLALLARADRPLCRRRAVGQHDRPPRGGRGVEHWNVAARADGDLPGRRRAPARRRGGARRSDAGRAPAAIRDGAMVVRPAGCDVFIGGDRLRPARLVGTDARLPPADQRRGDRRADGGRDRVLAPPGGARAPRRRGARRAPAAGRPARRRRGRTRACGARAPRRGHGDGDGDGDATTAACRCRPPMSR
jgi:hypothetical protein